MTTLQLSAIPRGAKHDGHGDTWFNPDASENNLRFLLKSGDGDALTVSGAIQVAMHVGLTIPRYWYYIGQVSYRSDEPILARKDRVLLLGNDFTGANELREIRLADPADQSMLDALLIGTLALIPAATEPGPTPPVILEVPGNGRAEQAPFWAGIGRHFYARPFPELTGNARLEWESHLASLLPRQPLVVSLLDPNTQMAIGAPAEEALELRDAALRCGFRQSRQVRICDGGPVFEAPTSFFRFAAGTSIEMCDHLGQSQRCVIRTEDRFNAWIVQAERIAGGIAVVSGNARLLDALSDRPWSYSFV